MEKLSEEIEGIATDIVDAAYRVHMKLGPGLIESIYETCLAHELKKRGRSVERQKIVPIVYDDIEFDEGLRLDLLVDGKVIAELKSVAELAPIHEAQLLSYMKLANRRLGFLINFNVPVIKQGIRRRIL